MPEARHNTLRGGVVGQESQDGAVQERSGRSVGGWSERKLPGFLASGRNCNAMLASKQPVLLSFRFHEAEQARIAGGQLPDPDYPNSLAPRFPRYLTRFETNPNAYDISF